MSTAQRNEDQLRDQYKRLASNVAGESESLPIRQDLDEFRSELGSYSDSNGETAQEFVDRFTSKLDQLTRELGDEYLSRIHVKLGDLSGLTEALSQEEMNEVDVWLNEMREQLTSIAPHLVEGIAGEHKMARAHLEALSLTNSAESDFNEVTTSVRNLEDELKGANATEARGSQIVLDARELLDRMNRHVADATGHRLSADALSTLRQIRDEAEEFWKVRRRAWLDAVTADEAEKYQEAYESFEYILEKEGAAAQVRYYDRLGADEPALVDVSVALEVLEHRRRSFVTRRAIVHAEKAREYLAEGDPRGAEKELLQVDAPDRELDIQYLDIDVRQSFNELREKVDDELEELSKFERNIEQAQNSTSPTESWRQMTQVGREYKRFISGSDVWKNARVRTETLCRQTCQRILGRICQSIRRDQLQLAQKSLTVVLDDFAEFAESFPDLVADAKRLDGGIRDLHQLLLDAQRYLDERDTHRAGSALDSAEELLSDIGGALQTIECELVDQSKIDELRSVLRASVDSESVLSAIAIRARNDGATTLTLRGVMDEIGAIRVSVPEAFKADWNEMHDYVLARYSMLKAADLLDEGSREDAISEYEKAERHSEFRAEATERRLYVEDTLLSADEEVSVAVKEVGKFLREGEYWRSFQTAEKYQDLPARDSMRNELLNLMKEAASRARDKYLRSLHDALRTNSGRPGELRQWLDHLATLDSAKARGLSEPVSLHALRIEAEGYVADAAWESAQKLFSEAFDLASASGDSKIRQDSSELESRALAARKQGLLQPRVEFDPEIVASLIQSELEQYFLADPDLTLARSMMIHEQYVGQHGAGPSEAVGFHSVRKNLALAQKYVVDAKTYASRWLTDDEVPDYEYARCELLGIPIAQIRDVRLGEIRNALSKLRSAARIARYKERIVGLLPTN